MHGVKNDPGLIPTERELKLTVKTKQSGLHRKEKDKMELMLDPTINTKTSKSNLIDAEIDTKGDESRLHGLTMSLITDTNSSVPSNNEEEVIEEDDGGEKVASIFEGRWQREGSGANDQIENVDET